MLAYVLKLGIAYAEVFVDRECNIWLADNR